MPAGGFAFGPYQLDPRAKHLLRDGTPVVLAGRQFELLAALVTQAGQIVSNDDLIREAWGDIAVGDNSLAQAVSHLRAQLDPAQPRRYIVNVRGRGYRFVWPVTRHAIREGDAMFDELLGPGRALTSGRAALETLKRDEIARARATFAHLVTVDADEPMYHVGLANACVLQFAASRASAMPDRESLRLAIHHAREACRLARDYAEAWATLGFVLECAGQRADAVAALQRALRLDPDNVAHHLRFASASWGDGRRRAAEKVLKLHPGLALACVLVATIYIAKGVLDEADRELNVGLAALRGTSGSSSRYPVVGLYWLKGLLCLARGNADEGVTWLERELALEEQGHFLANECSANAWYAIGACRLRQGDESAARAAFEEALTRAPRHPMVQAGLVMVSRRAFVDPPAGPLSVDIAMAKAAVMAASGNLEVAVALVSDALLAAPEGNAGWLIPVDPLLNVHRHPDAWAPVLAKVRERAG